MRRAWEGGDIQENNSQSSELIQRNYLNLWGRGGWRVSKYYFKELIYINMSAGCFHADDVWANILICCQLFTLHYNIQSDHTQHWSLFCIIHDLAEESNIKIPSLFHLLSKTICFVDRELIWEFILKVYVSRLEWTSAGLMRIWWFCWRMLDPNRGQQQQQHIRSRVSWSNL